jgi:diguanylate cyclase (GGDEF)-like protein
MELRLLPLLLAMGSALVIFSFLAAIATRHFIVLPQLREFEALADRKDLRRILLVIDNKKLQLATLVYQGAMDDRSYEFTQHPNPQMFDTNVSFEEMSNFHVDFIAVFDRHNQLIGSRLAREIGSSFKTASWAPTDLQPLLIDLSAVKERAPLFNADFALTPQGPIVYAVASIMRSDTSGAAGGNLLLATAFDRAMLREIEESAQLSIEFSQPSPTDIHALPQSPDAVYRDDKDRITWLLRNEKQQPILKLVLLLPRRDYDTNLVALPVLVSFGSNLIGFGLILFLFRSVLIEPMLEIGRHLRKVRMVGDYSARLNNNSKNEVGDLSRDIDALVQHVQIQRDQLQAQAAEMQTLSFQDGLTGLANRRRFDQALADNWALAQRAQAPLALIMFDVDYFKNYNDHYGHQLGDEALKKLADITRHTIVRQSDVAARYGGEEFAILLPETTESGAEQIAQRLQSELHMAAILHQQSHIDRLLTISIGIAALVPGSRNSQRDLVHRADAALYSSKASGRNCITLASRLDIPAKHS